jgi:hypothetical protein
MRNATLLILLICITCLQTTAQTGNVGIGTSTPKARLHVTDSSVVFSAFGNVSGLIGKPPIEGAGKRMMWYVDKAAFRVGHVWGSNCDKDSIGDYSFAAGDDNKASGIFSTAFGVNGNARGWYSFVAGTDNSALATGNIAMGYNNTVRNTFSAAIGSSLITKSLGAISLGYLNDTSDAQNAEGSSQFTDRILQLGNGFGGTRSNAITILRNGYTGIGPVVPKAKLHVDSSVVFTGHVLPANASFPLPAIEGAGTRMLWYPEKGAVRFGTIDDGPLLGGTTNLYLTNQWDANNIGRFSFAAGYNTKATGQGNVALGLNNAATGLNGAVAMGNYSIASGEASFALGYGNNAIGGSATSLGYYNNAGGFAATCMGYSTIANGSASVSMGNYTIARGDNAVSLGYQNIARSNNSLVVGKYNDTTNTNRLFEIGNGTAYAARSNALTVLTNGNTGIGSANPANQLEVIGAASANPVTLVIGNRGGFGPTALEFVSDYGLVNQWRPGYIKNNDLGAFTGALEFYTNGTGAANLYGNVKGFEVRNGAALTATGTVSTYSDARLKNDITPFTDGLNVISKINPVQFYYNANAPFKTEIQQTGVIAQELEKIAPYMVEKNKQNGYDDLRSVNNQAYTFLLINAVKEQQVQISTQQKEIDELKALVNQLLKK